jgi:hypothetical protein
MVGALNPMDVKTAVKAVTLKAAAIVSFDSRETGNRQWNVVILRYRPKVKILCVSALLVRY